MFWVSDGEIYKIYKSTDVTIYLQKLEYIPPKKVNILGINLFILNE